MTEQRTYKQYCNECETMRTIPHKHRAPPGVRHKLLRITVQAKEWFDDLKDAHEKDQGPVTQTRFLNLLMFVYDKQRSDMSKVVDK